MDNNFGPDYHMTMVVNTKNSPKYWNKPSCIGCNFILNRWSNFLAYLLHPSWTYPAALYHTHSHLPKQIHRREVSSTILLLKIVGWIIKKDRRLSDQRDESISWWWMQSVTDEKSLNPRWPFTSHGLERRLQDQSARSLSSSMVMGGREGMCYASLHPRQRTSTNIRYSTINWYVLVIKQSVKNLTFFCFLLCKRSCYFRSSELVVSTRLALPRLPLDRRVYTILQMRWILDQTGPW